MITCLDRPDLQPSRGWVIDLRLRAALSVLPFAGTFSKSVASKLNMNDRSKQSPAATNRRDFFKKTFAGIISALLALVPLGAGLAVFLDPLRRKSSGGSAIRVTTLDALPNDGVPRKFTVLSTRVDAWNKFRQTPVGAVYLRRTSDGTVHAFNVVCPHAGCFVDFLPERGYYLCPCHNSTFSITGKVDDPSSPAARGLDSLEVEVRNQKEVWVKFQNFQAGHAEKIPVA
jgi:menaquinol-cytochrome c reductase iron-sulfur subunit